MVRTGLGLACGAATAALAALVLGEYELQGLLPVGAGLLLGLLLGEVVVSVGRSRTVLVAVVAAVLAAAGMGWAGWIDSAQGLEPVKAGAWVGAAVAAVAAGLRTAGLGRRAHSASER